MTELVFKGAFETQNSEIFLKGLEQLFKDTDTQFRGQILRFEVDNYTDYIEIKDTEIIEQTEKNNDSINKNAN